MTSLTNIAFRFLFGLALCCSAGCATIKNTSSLSNGPGIDFVPTEIKSFSTAQELVIAELYVMAGLSKPVGTAQPAWDQLIIAGMDYADRQCEEYMHSLFRLNRDRRTAVSQLGLVGTATAGLMAAAQSAARSVAAAAIVFGLSASTIDNLSSNLLFDLDPSSVRTLVKALQGKFRQALGTGYTTRSASMTAIRRYAEICVPANIEAEVNLAVKKAQPNSSKADPPAGKPPTVSNAELVSRSANFENDAASSSLDAFVFPNGVLNANNQRRLENYLKSREVKASTVMFINGSGFAEERVRAAKFFGLME